MSDPEDLQAGEPSPDDGDMHPRPIPQPLPAAAAPSIPPRESRPAGFYPHPFEPGREIWWSGESWSDKTPDEVYAEEQAEIVKALPVVGGVLRFINKRPAGQLYALGIFLLFPTFVAFAADQRGVGVLLLFLILGILGSKRVAIWRYGNPIPGDPDAYSDSYSADRLRQPM